MKSALIETRQCFKKKMLPHLFDWEPEKKGDVSLNSDLAVQDHHMLGVGGQPGLHGLTYGTDLIQRRGVEVWPAKVVNLLADGDNGLNFVGLEEIQLWAVMRNTRRKRLPLDLVG